MGSRGCQRQEGFGPGLWRWCRPNQSGRQCPKRIHVRLESSPPRKQWRVEVCLFNVVVPTYFTTVTSVAGLSGFTSKPV